MVETFVKCVLAFEKNCKMHSCCLDCFGDSAYKIVGLDPGVHFLGFVKCYKEYVPQTYLLVSVTELQSLA